MNKPGTGQEEMDRYNRGGVKNKFFAGLTRAQFLRRHWQKKPLLARNALHEYADAITLADLIALAARADIESRIVTRTRGRWHVRYGPFDAREIKRMPTSGWTLLVQGTDTALTQASRLLREFAFIPHARVDDVMVSYAAPGGGVGPHFDSYDVFLVQGAGERRWRIGEQRDLSLVADAPLKLLQRFEPREEWTLGPGDVLYLPPRWAHDGVAVGQCITYSIGFRAPRMQELASAFLEDLQDRLGFDGEYADPGLTPTRHPGRIPKTLLQHGSRALARVRWSDADVARFIGRYLSEPKPLVTFSRPRRPLDVREFAEHARRRGVRLALQSRMLYRANAVFMNGEASSARGAMLMIMRTLADQRAIAPPLNLTRACSDRLYGWYLAGYIELGLRD